MKNIMVLMHDDAGQEARFQGALDLTRALDGHLTCVDVSVMPAMVGAYADCGGTALLIDDEQRRETANRTRMEARLRAEDVPYEWVDESGFLTPCMRDMAGMADLIVLNRELDEIKYPDMLALVGEMVTKTGKAIVAMPGAARKFDVYGPALVAWDGSQQSEASLRAALPLLKHASSVTILAIDDGSLKQPASEAAKYLSRHEIKATVRLDTSMIDLPSTMVLDAIEALGIAYLVMGGFGHSRFMEAAFGGFTRRMLKECPVPIFLAH